MKHLLILLLLHYGHLCFSQINDDSLSKYSYGIVQTDIKGKQPKGSGFFIEGRKSLYFITAKHVISGCNPVGKRDIRIPDTLLIVLKDSNKSFPIRIREFSDNIPCMSAASDTDYFVIPVPLWLKKSVHPVYLLNRPILNNEIQISVWGVPGINYDTSIFAEHSKINLPKAAINFYNYKNHYDFLYPDFLKNYKELDGFSGSPVFMLDSSNRFRIIGVYSLDSPKTLGHQISIAPIEAVIERIKKVENY